MNILEKVLNNPTLNKAVQKGVEKTLDGLNIYFYYNIFIYEILNQLD